MRKSLLVVVALGLALLPSRLDASELRAGLGIFLVAPQGADLQLSFRPEGQSWVYGVRYVRWMDTFTDPYTGTDLTETTETRYGLTVDYLFDPDGRSSWYLSGAVYAATKSEHSLLTLETGEDEATSPYLGGGWTTRFGASFYFDFGMLISPGAKLATSTSVSSEEDSGMFDVRLILGFSF